MTTIPKRQTAGQVPGWFAIAVAGDDETPAPPASAVVICPKGHTLSLGNHEISPDGTVSPSVICTVGNCTFHDSIQLLGWTP